jgi:N-acetylglucosamine-6-sulfatase
MRNGPNGTEGQWPLMTLGPQGTWTYLNRQHADRLEVMRAIDDAVGAIVDALAARGVLNRTLVMFVSDNGYALGEHRRGGTKMDAYEESIRVPLVIREPGVRTQRSTKLTALNLDWGPTLADYAGTTLRDADGRSLRGIISGQIPKTWRKRFLIEHWFNLLHRPGPLLVADLPDYRAIRTVSGHAFPNELYVEYTSSNSAPPYTDGTIIDREQYDLARDPYEVSSVHASSQHKQERRILSAELSQLVRCAGETCRYWENH